MTLARGANHPETKPCRHVRLLEYPCIQAWSPKSRASLASQRLGARNCRGSAFEGGRHRNAEDGQRAVKGRRGGGASERVGQSCTIFDRYFVHFRRAGTGGVWRYRPNMLETLQRRSPCRFLPHSGSIRGFCFGGDHARFPAFPGDSCHRAIGSCG